MTALRTIEIIKIKIVIATKCHNGIAWNRGCNTTNELSESDDDVNSGLILTSAAAAAPLLKAFVEKNAINSSVEKISDILKILNS